VSSWSEKILLIGEEIILSRLVGIEGPGPLFRWIFKIPIFFFRIGLTPFGDHILLLTTIGRKSGKPRSTPVEYRTDAATGERIVIAGWGGRTDWRRNIQADPHVRVQVQRRIFDAVAEPLPAAEVADWLGTVLRINPRSKRYLSRWAGDAIDADNVQSLMDAANYFPSFRLVPVGKIQQPHKA